MMHDAAQHALDADATTSLGDAACPRGKWGCSPELGQGQSMASVAAPHHPRITQEKRRKKNSAL